jgi:hypothetical protein
VNSETKTVNVSRTAKPIETGDGLLQAIEYLGDGLIVAAARFADAKCAVHVADWHGAKKLLQKGFAEFSTHARYRGVILSRLAGLQRRAKRGRV